MNLHMRARASTSHSSRSNEDESWMEKWKFLCDRADNDDDDRQAIPSEASDTKLH